MEAAPSRAVTTFLCSGTLSGVAYVWGDSQRNRPLSGSAGAKTCRLWLVPLLLAEVGCQFLSMSRRWLRASLS